MVLPAGTTLPPLPHALGLLAAAGLVGFVLVRQGVELDGPLVLALSPWMITGAILYALYQIAVPPDPIAPLFSSPTVYLTTATVAGAVLAGSRAVFSSPDQSFTGTQSASGDAAAGAPADGADETLPPVWSGRQSSSLRSRVSPSTLSVAAFGSIVALTTLAVALAAGRARGTLAPAWPAVGAVVGVGLGWSVWRVFAASRPEAAAVLGRVGLLAVVGHALDGVSTAVGVDVFGYGEQTPLSRLIMDLAGSLPTAPLLGVGWLFVLVKVAVALLVVWLLAGYVREEPTPGYALLTIVIAVGLGPGVHNLVLFAVAGPAGI
ncbi:MAG: DUF63 family protein [Halodesulfurarchaeum sp.]